MSFLTPQSKHPFIQSFLHSLDKYLLGRSKLRTFADIFFDTYVVWYVNPNRGRTWGCGPVGCLPQSGQS